MTDQELKDLVANNAKSISKNAKSISKNAKSISKNEDMIDKLGAKIDRIADSHKIMIDNLGKKIDRIADSHLTMINKLGAKIDKIGKLNGNLANNIGTVSENFFFQGLKKKEQLQNIHFDSIHRNIHTFNKEYDLVGVNGKELVVISVKHILNINDVEKFAKEDLQQFVKDFPEFSSYDIYGGVAGMDIHEDAQDTAIQKGFFVLGQSGENIAILNDTNFCPRKVMK